MRRFLDKLREDKFISLGVRLNLILWLVSFFLLLFFWRWLPPQVPLFYSRPWGESQLVSPIGLILLPLFSLLIFILNFGLILRTFKEERFIARILAGAGLIFTFLCTLALFRIIILIT